MVCGNRKKQSMNYPNLAAVYADLRSYQQVMVQKFLDPLKDGR